MGDTEAGDLFRQGKLDAAVEAAGRALKRQPGDIAARLLLAELLVFTGDLARADTVVGAAETLQPEAALPVAEFRQLLRAASARRDVFRDGRVPEFLGEPTEGQQAALRALVALREGDAAAAAAAAEQAEAVRPIPRGEANGEGFEDFRDVDDVVAGSLEVLTTTGKYFWVPVDRVVSMELHAPKRPRDLVWWRCTMMVRDGPHGDVYLPVLYEAPGEDDELRLGRRTEWSPDAPVRGRGQRLFLVGQDALALSGLKTVEFA